MEQFNKFLTYLSDISPISEEAMEGIKNLCSSVHVKKNNNLQSIGQTCRTIYFVVEGTARINYFKEDKDVTEYFAFENDIIIRAESLFTWRPSHKAIQAISDTTFIAIPASQLFEVFEKHHEVERLLER